MSIEDVKRSYDNNEYKTKLSYPKRSKFKETQVFDEDRSVKWNREESIRKNKEIDEAYESYRNDEADLWDKFKTDIVQGIMDDYDLSKEKANLIYGYAYREWHSCVNDMFCNLDELCELIEKVLKA